MKQLTYVDFPEDLVKNRKCYESVGFKETGMRKEVGVLYGYGNYEELENAGADYIVEKIEDILSIV